MSSWIEIYSVEKKTYTMFCSPGPCRSVILTTGKLVPSEWFTIFRPFVYIVYAVQNKRRWKEKTPSLMVFHSLSIFSVMPISFFPQCIYFVYLWSRHTQEKKKAPKNHTIGISIYLAKIWTKCEVLNLHTL